ncbi:Myb-like DNA-binding domain containing protein [Tritrichomonas foetus]|uniref:Myb-like DNA-binding domain containing protein n=1 Tax=Tritrichomonas foetus TaxID=1144522 RepID=A0A1J4J3P5_9EUKA|nr:Myb-like DNA-binding domain containing protein [Tritrichomonas foetus]|eukprot:OHS92783.1 Myb-like DNA-binding domain containing protein [Tritrichomonas foetus]
MNVTQPLWPIYIIPEEKLIDENRQRFRFSNKEDVILLSLVKDGKPKWNEIALNLPGRTARQCRERYTNYLRPDLNKSQWTIQEDEMLGQKYQIYGPQWKIISTFFPGRSPVNVKNHHSCLLLRESKKKQGEIQKDKTKKAEPTSSNIDVKKEGDKSIVDWFTVNNDVGDSFFDNQSHVDEYIQCTKFI